MSSTPALLLWFLDHPPPGFPMNTSPLWALVQDYITTPPHSTRPATEAELHLLSEVTGASLKYAERMGAGAAAGAGAGVGAMRTGGSSSSPSGSSISLLIAQKMHRVTQQIQMGALVRLTDLLSCEVTDQARVMDALRSPAVVKLAMADLAVCCEYLYQQNQQYTARSAVASFTTAVLSLDQQQEQLSAPAGQWGIQQTHASSANKARASSSGPPSFGELLLYPDYEQVWVPGGEQGRKWHLEALQITWERGNGGVRSKGSSIALCAFVGVAYRINMLAAPRAVANHTLSTATHLKLLLEVLALVGWVEEQEGTKGPLGWVEGQEDTEGKGPDRGVEPILRLLQVSLEGAKREEREAFVASRGKLLLSVLQLLLRKVGAVGGGDESGG